MKIILAVDDTPSSDEVVDSIFSGNWPEDVAFKIVTVLEPLCVSFEDLTIAEFSQSASQIYVKRKEAARLRCETNCQKIETAFPKASVSYEIREGAPWAEIVNAAAQWSADSIIVGERARDIPTSRIASVGRAIVEHSLCSVSVVPSGKHATTAVCAKVS